MTKFLDLIKSKNMTPERFQEILSSGIMTDLLDENANLSQRPNIRVALGLPLEKIGIYYFDADLSIKTPSERLENCQKSGWEVSDIHLPRLESGGNLIPMEARILKVEPGSTKQHLINTARKMDEEYPWMLADIDCMLDFARTYPHIFQIQRGLKRIMGIGGECERHTILVQTLPNGMFGGVVNLFTSLVGEPSLEILPEDHDGGRENGFLIVRPGQPLRN